MAVETNGLITLIYPDDAAMKELEREADGKWRVFDGLNWKFQLETKYEAIKLAERLGGTLVARSMWEEKEEKSVYAELEKVEVEK